MLCLLLLVAQAFCDLSLPRYTSLIVDVGIQQGGIEDASPSALSAETYEKLQGLLDAQGQALLAASYTQDQGRFQLNSEGEGAREQLNTLLAAPLAYIWGLSDNPAGGEDGLDDQKGIEAARCEYQALGFDMQAMQMDYLLRTGAVMLALAALIMVIMIAIGFVSTRTASKIAWELRRAFFARVIAFSEAEIDSFSAASLITRGTNDIQLIQNMCTMMMRMVMYAPILAVGGVVMVALTAPSMAWVIVAAVAVLLVVMAGLMAVTGPAFRAMQSLIDKVNLIAREILTGLPVVRAFGREDHEQKRFEDASFDLMKTQLFTNRVLTFMMPAMTLIMNGVSVAIVWFGGIQVSMGTLQTGDLIALITYAMVIILGFLMIGMISIMLPRAVVAAQRVNEVIETKVGIADPENPQDAQLPTRNEAPGARIEFKDVCFAYENAERNTLDHVSFTAEPGQTVAIVGSTGSGKTTVLKLIERFRDVTSGSVAIDGVDVRDLTQDALRCQIGYVPQKAFLFAGTVQSNVAYSNDALGMQQVEEALRIAQASEFVHARAEGLQAPVAQGGSNVSGGQRQRLAIARALAVPARAYLFDDSFSALDYKTDAALRAELERSLGGATVIIVAQRIATIMNASAIVVLDEGKVVGQGTHDQLLSTCSVYRAIAESQLSAEELEKTLSQAAVQTAEGGDRRA